MVSGFRKKFVLAVRSTITTVPSTVTEPKPIIEAVTSYVPGGMFKMKYSPLRLVAAPKEVPLIIILQPINGWLF